MKVIIVGAGISGLTLAAALAQLAPQHEVELYERDASAAGIAARGRKAVLESRRSAEQFHATSRVQILSRNLGFRVGNAVINSRLTTRKAAVPTTSVR